MSPSPALLGRDEFRARVLARHGGACCVPGCGCMETQAHHILERRLFADGGYYLANGAALCGEHHFAAEITTISVEQLREWCGISAPVLPPQFEAGERLDKWGNPVLPNGARMRGELFFDEAAQKALALGGASSLFTALVKYPRTWHMPSSPGASDDDKMLRDLEHFRGRRVVATIKKDGENATLMRDHFHARSLDSRHHPSRDWIKGFWGAVRYDIPEEWRVCGENLYARHSIAYEDLPSYFLGFSVWDDRNSCLGWDDTLEWFHLIGSSCGLHIEPSETVYDGLFDEVAIQEAARRVVGGGEEGLVLRLADAFSYRDFRRAVAKYVRPGHVQTDKHWMHREVVPNGLAQPAVVRRLGLK